MPKYYSDSFQTSGGLTYDVGIEIGYSRLKTSYWYGVPYPEWIGAKHRRSLGSGTIRL
jgi:hypothetical protein